MSRPSQTLGELCSMMKFASKMMSRPGEPRIRCPLSRLTLGLIKPEGKPPRLRMKAANTRYLLPIVRYVLEHIFPPTSPREQLRLDCLIALDDLYILLNNWSDHADASQRCAELGRKHVVLYAELGALEVAKLGDHERWLYWRIVTAKSNLKFSFVWPSVSMQGDPNPWRSRQRPTLQF